MFIREINTVEMRPMGFITAFYFKAKIDSYSNIMSSIST